MRFYRFRIGQCVRMDLSRRAGSALANFCSNQSLPHGWYLAKPWSFASLNRCLTFTIRFVELRDAVSFYSLLLFRTLVSAMCAHIADEFMSNGDKSVFCVYGFSLVNDTEPRVQNKWMSAVRRTFDNYFLGKISWNFFFLLLNTIIIDLTLSNLLQSFFLIR